MEPPRLSIVIVNWNTNDLLNALMRSIVRWAPPFKCEVIVVDNASDYFDPNFFNEEFPWTKLIANRENAGYAKGNNQAFEVATGEYILLLNPDTRVTKSALETLVEFMDSNLDAGAAGAKLVRPDETVERSARGFPYPAAIAWEYLGLSRLFPKSRAFGAYRMTYFNYDELAEVDQPMGSALVLRKRVLDEVGPFDEQFPIFFNEVDWLYRAKTAGHKVYFVPQAEIVHHGAASTKQVKRRKMVRESHESLIRFYEKHFKGRISGPCYAFTVACIKLSKILRG